MLMNEKFLETKGINSIKFIWLNFKFELKPRHIWGHKVLGNINGESNSDSILTVYIRNKMPTTIVLTNDINSSRINRIKKSLLLIKLIKSFYTVSMQ